MNNSCYNFLAKYCPDEVVEKGGCPLCGGTDPECAKCAEKLKKNLEYIQTHDIITDTCVQDYHNCDHEYFKRAKRRMPNENPTLYYGVELEMMFDSPYDEECDEYDKPDFDWIIERVAEITGGMFVAENDGSLEDGSNYGIEFISRPCSYAYWTSPETVEKIKNMMKFLREHDAYESSCAGMHIHVSRRFFEARGVMGYERELTWLVGEFQEGLEMIGGRKFTSYCVSWKDSMKQSINAINSNLPLTNVRGELKKENVRAGHDGRYSAVNAQNRNTVEFRFFGSTLDPERFLASIETARALCHHVASKNAPENSTLGEILHNKETLFLDKVLNDLHKRQRGREKKALEEVDTDTVVVEA
ncbi:MAG: amidoligase family protein [Methanobrevibacter sp.]|nr:amidoligase family protein [Methanobrevibacter sp.]